MSLVEATQQIDMERNISTVHVITLVTVKFNKAQSLKETISRSVDALTNPNGHVILHLLSKDVDPETMRPKISRKAILQWSKNTRVESETHTYKVNIEIDRDFGMPGAISVCNYYQEEFFLTSISVEGIVHFACKSWIQPAKIHSQSRIFFCNKAYLPSQTPEGLIELRKRELRNLQGNGKGLRFPSDRIYDYDVYNDLGNPDKGTDFARPTLGGKNNPHPRRCRTGRPSTKADTNAEIPPSPSNPAYVPRDEEYEEIKKKFMSRGRLKGLLRNIVPMLITKMFDERTFYTAVDSENRKSKRKVQIFSLDKKLNKNPTLHILNKINELIEMIFKLDPPKYISKDQIWGLPDDEFGRRVLGGVNPVNIEKMKSFPPVSKLDPSIYGSQESALNEEQIISHLEGMSVQQALNEDKLFILDHHDIHLPFIDDINEIEGRKVYATRTIFFLTQLCTLKPVAIKLSLPSNKEVLTPPTDGTTNWLWQLAKQHVWSNDTSIHTLVNHWLRIHACMEPFIISAHRNLSVMHPIFKLLHPHMRYLIKTNAFTREVLIGAGAIVETFNAPAKYSMQISSSAYRDSWRFDQESLPADLVRRGMATVDSTKPHGLKLTIEDYPYAQDGLLIWSAIENLVKKYVNHYYPEAELVKNDTELQAWYTESINIGHADLREATWWPNLSNQDDLINILTTIIWTVTGQHVIINFGQYSYGAYAQAVLDLASGHSPDEAYIGERKEFSSWSGEQEILEAFYQFSMDIEKVGSEIERRNSDPRLRNRNGDKAFPFELLIPRVRAGTTNTGVPNSVTA